MLYHKHAQTIQFVRAESAGLRKADRIEPEFCTLSACST
jgi:hypothetical protein